MQWMVADMATEAEAARQLVMNTASLRDAGLPFNTEASMAKLFGSRVAMESAYKAVQIHGGAGYFSPTPVERYFRDARVSEIYEGDQPGLLNFLPDNMIGVIFSSLKHLTTWAMASTSRICPKNLLPKPSP